MTLKKYVENNPFFFLLGTAVTVAGVVAGVLLYFCHERIDLANQKSNLEISTLQSELYQLEGALAKISTSISALSCTQDRGNPSHPLTRKQNTLLMTGSTQFSICRTG